MNPAFWHPRDAFRFTDDSTTPAAGGSGAGGSEPSESFVPASKVNEIVANRLGREKAKHEQEIASLKAERDAAKADLDTHKAKVQEFTTKLTDFENIQKEIGTLKAEKTELTELQVLAELGVSPSEAKRVRACLVIDKALVRKDDGTLDRDKVGAHIKTAYPWALGSTPPAPTPNGGGSGKGAPPKAASGNPYRDALLKGQ